MPTYEFVCEHCRFRGECTCAMSDPLPEKCPDCGERREEVFHQVYSGDNFVFCKGEPTTFGQQAEANAKRVGKEQMQKMVEEHQVGNRKGKFTGKLPAGGKLMMERYRAERPWWRDTNKPLDVSKIADPKKFIFEGKTS